MSESAVSGCAVMLVRMAVYFYSNTDYCVVRLHAAPAISFRIQSYTLSVHPSSTRLLCGTSPTRCLSPPPVMVPLAAPQLILYLIASSKRILWVLPISGYHATMVIDRASRLASVDDDG